VAKRKHRLRNIVLLSAVSFAIAAAIFLFDLAAAYENKSFDLFSRYLNPERASDRIVIIEIDQQSIDALSAENITWPWPRQVYAPIIEFVSRADALFVDILYTEPSSYGEEDDRILGEAISRASNVYLPFFLSRNEKPLGPEDLAYLKRFAIPADIPVSTPYRSAVTPISQIRTGVKGAGNVAISPDSDGVYRRVPVSFRLRDMTLPSLILSSFINTGTCKAASGRLMLGKNYLPLTDGKLLLRFPRGKNPYRTIPAIDILEAYRAGKKTGITPDEFKGKAVFLGMTAPGLLDLKATPTMSVSTGVHVNAAMFENLESGTFMRPVPQAVVLLSMLLICIFITSVVISSHTVGKNLSAFIGASIVVIGIAALLFLRQHYLPTTYFMITVVVSFLLSVAFSYAVEGRERQFIKRTFSQYMDKTIVDYVLQNPEIVKPGGKKARVTVLFADIAGFTTISEKNTPEDTALMLHRVLNELTEVVIEEKGVVDKYIGDCIMAFWGSPLALPEDEINACRSALRFIEAIYGVNAVFALEGTPSIAIRVGLHTGDAIAGNMGSVRLFDFTVVGDTVNLASRLESVNKVFGTRVITSEPTLAGTHSLFLTRNLGPIEVKGKSEPVTIHELMSVKANATTSDVRKAAMYTEAFCLYREGKFTEAIHHFEAVLSEFPDDGPSLFYKRRAENLKDAFPLTKNWDIIKMTEK
jgi:adenylate cyclase